MRASTLFTLLLVAAGPAAAKSCNGKPCQQAPCAKALKSAGVLDKNAQAYLDCRSARQVVLPGATTTVVSTVTVTGDATTLQETQTTTITADPATVTETATTTTFSTVYRIVSQATPVIGRRITSAGGDAPTLTTVPEYLSGTCASLDDFLDACACFDVPGGAASATATVTVASTVSAPATASPVVETVTSAVTTTPVVTATATTTTASLQTSAVSSFVLRSVEDRPVYFARYSFNADDGYFIATPDPAAALTCQIFAPDTIKCGNFYFAQYAPEGRGPNYVLRAFSAAGIAQYGPGGYLPVPCSLDEAGGLHCNGPAGTTGRIQFSYRTIATSPAEIDLSPPSWPRNDFKAVSFQAVPR